MLNPITIMALASAAKGAFDILGAVIGNAVSAKDRAEAERLARQAYDKILAIGAPPDQAKKIFYEEFKSAGLLTPQVTKAIEATVPKIVSYKEDPALKKAQMESLSSLSQIGKLGETAEERAQRILGARETERLVAGESGRQQQELAAKGLEESGAAIAGRFASADRARQIASEQALKSSAAAQARALEGITQAGTLAERARTQEFGFAEKKSDAEAEMDRFNVERRQAAQQYNLQQQAAAQQYNLEEKQRIMDANIKMRNEERKRQREAQLENWKNKLSWAQTQGGTMLGQSQLAAEKAAQTQQMWQGIMSGAGSIAGAGISAYGQSAAKADSISKLAKSLNITEQAASTLMQFPDAAKSPELLNRIIGSSQVPAAPPAPTMPVTPAATPSPVSGQFDGLPTVPVVGKPFDFALPPEISSYNRTRLMTEFNMSFDQVNKMSDAQVSEFLSYFNVPGSLKQTVGVPQPVYGRWPNQ
jgi:hypothetical protein